MFFMKIAFRRSMLPFSSLHHDNKSLKYGCTNTFEKKEPNYNKVTNSVMLLFTTLSAWFDLGLYFIIYLYIFYGFIPQSISISNHLIKYPSKQLALQSSIMLIATFKKTTLIDSNNLNGGKVHLKRLLLSCFYKRSNHQGRWVKN